MDSVNAPEPLGPLQQLQLPTASLMASRTDEIATEHWNASSTMLRTRPAPEADAAAASAGSASSKPTQLTTTSSEDSMEHEDNNPSDWDTVHYRRYTTRRLKGELRLERVSRPHFFVLVRPLNQMSIQEIPKSAITRLIGQTAPTSVAAEHSAFKYIVKANAVRLSIWDKQHLHNLLAQGELTLTLGSVVEARRIPVEIVGATQPSEVTSKGVVKIRAEHTEEYIANHIRCESANILGFRIMGKTQMLLITFDTPRPPRRPSLDYEIVPVYEHRPRALACFRCHGLGHIAIFCPSQAVCRHCGRTHEEDSQCEETPFCVACQAAGHISLDPNCPTRAFRATSPPLPKKNAAAKSNQGEQPEPLDKNTGTPPKTWSQVTASNAGINNNNFEDRLERFEQVQAASTGAWNKFQQQMENFMQQKLDAMQQQITSWIQASQGIREQTAINSPSQVKPKKSDGPPLPKKPSPAAAEHTVQANPATQPRIEKHNELQRTPSTLDRKPSVTMDQALDTIMQLLEKLNSRMEAIERAMAQQEQVIMQHKEVNEREIAQIKATADECKRNYRRARNRSRE
ncbi:hypothetical protein HPB52_022587 [Rhipicephalus sanguineus]|uniref:CCHC-type domain-containing protein n=1 Tax=Rhipicephalus sanguineus TaxID=34632 RepID=A0A9D4SRI9_RHISA|nr:hypothetical protein HPB52_022587 [Rhipicephalus sanguineus]